MTPSVTRARAAVLPRESVGRRLAISLLMVLSILVASFLTTSAAHASLDGGQAGLEQSIDSKGDPAGLDGPGKAPHGKAFGGAQHCTGHCASHAAGLPELFAGLAVVEHPSVAWPVTHGAELTMRSSARLERPPRL